MINAANLSKETIDLTNAALSKEATDLNIRKSFVQNTGLINYDLQAPSKHLYPVITPLRNRIPRVKGDGDTTTHWKALTGININKTSPWVSEGNRGGYEDVNLVNRSADYKGLGLESFVSYEARYAAVGFENVLALNSLTLLQSLMIQEEMSFIGSNGSVALGTTPTPTATASITGGSLAAATYSVICVALAYDGNYRGSIVNGLVPVISRTNADSSVDTINGGVARKSSAASAIVASGTTGSIAASVAPVTGAVAYAWYWGAAGSEVIGAITTINSFVITAAATGTQTAASLPSTDNSVNTLGFDGLIYQVAAGTGGYYRALGTGSVGTGSALTSDGAAGIVEIDDALRSFWDNYNVSPGYIVVNAQELANINKKIIAGGGAPLFRFNVDGQSGSVADVTLTAGSVVGSYLNKYSMDGGSMLRFILHPNMPRGTMMFFSDKPPYSNSNVGNVLEARCRQDYYQVNWAATKRRDEFGVYVDEVLANYFTPMFGVITNIGNG